LVVDFGKNYTSFKTLSMPKKIVIFNPTARGEKSKKLSEFLLRLSKNDRSITLAPTVFPGAATQLASKAIEDGFDLVIAAGGDGTINEIVNAIYPSKISLGILPLGTANVFARELRIPFDIETAWNVALSGVTRCVDLGCAEFSDKTRLFVQLAGVGLDALAVRNVSWKLKKIFGPLSYVWSGLEVIAGEEMAFRVHANGLSKPEQSQAVFVGNGKFYGGSIPMFPRAELDDGLLDVCLFPSKRVPDLVRYTSGLFRGTHTNFSDVIYFQASSVECEPIIRKIPFELDGDDFGDAPVRFKAINQALRVVIPHGSIAPSGIEASHSA